MLLEQDYLTYVLLEELKYSLLIYSVLDHLGGKPAPAELLGLYSVEEYLTKDIRIVVDECLPDIRGLLCYELVEVNGILRIDKVSLV